MIVVNKDRTLITHTRDDNGEVRYIPVTCYIRDHTANPDAHPENANGAFYPGFYQPKEFPSGEWVVTRIEPNDDPYTAPFFIATNAHQTVTCFDGSVVEDAGYGIHYSTSPTTWGCLRVETEGDLRWLASLVKPGERVLVE
jgi:L,D-transpeptidase catalytic domain